MIIAGFPKLFPIVSLTSGAPPKDTRRETITHAKRTDKRTDKDRKDKDDHREDRR